MGEAFLYFSLFPLEGEAKINLSRFPVSLLQKMLDTEKGLAHIAQPPSH